MTDGNSWLLPAIVGSSILPGILIFFLREEWSGIRTALNLSGAFLKVFLIFWVLHGFFQGESYEFRYAIGVDLEFYFRVDSLSLLFATLSAMLWLVTTFYAIGYLEGSANRRRFFGFFSLCVTASTGIALAGNLVTFFIFYEFLTLATYPLVVHRGTEKALEAGRTYLWYTIGGGTVLFVGVVWMFVLTGPVDFGDTAALTALGGESATHLFLLFWVMIAGLAVKAAIFPLHGWLPVAMVAPAPVSALLHAVAVVKAGAFGIIRVVYDIFGLELSVALGVLEPLAFLAAFTIIYGSVRALQQTDLKRRLAYSTVSQLSYIAMGVATPGILASTGAVAHLVHQGVMKITLFFCAGTFAETVGAEKITDLRGIGRRMPLTMGAFTIGALGMMGFPPLAGFISKWYLGQGALQTGQVWIVMVLLTSSALNAAYFLPIIYRAWFEPAPREWRTLRSSHGFEAPLILLLPLLITGVASLALGLFASSPWSILEFARTIAEKLYP